MSATTQKNLEKHLTVLTKDIGVRLAGSLQERQAADYIAKSCRKYSPKVTIEAFPVKERSVTKELLEVKIGGKWKKFPCSLFNLAATTNGKTVEAELVYFDTASGYQRPDLSFLTGKGVVHLGCHIESEECYKRIMAAKPAFILFVDTRYTGTVNLADGLFPSYVAKYGSVPSLNVAYFDAWSWLKAQAKRARICIEGRQKPSKTTVVICELPGTDPSSGIIYVGGHHDTQAGTVGADDNACGSAAVIELSRLLSKTPHKRTIRLCSFGAEEQLSAGSAAYVRAHRAEIRKKGVFMCNFDSFGSALGWYAFTINGKNALREVIAEEFHKKDIYYTESTEPCPYTDQFPFAACGVPGIWISRDNCDTGCYYHHRVDNVMENLDTAMMASVVETAAAVLEKLANEEKFSKYAGMPSSQQKKIDALFLEVYGGF